jgi:hypothetical protein
MRKEALGAGTQKGMWSLVTEWKRAMGVLPPQLAIQRHAGKGFFAKGTSLHQWKRIDHSRKARQAYKQRIELIELSRPKAQLASPRGMNGASLRQGPALKLGFYKTQNAREELWYGFPSVRPSRLAFPITHWQLDIQLDIRR